MKNYLEHINQIKQLYSNEIVDVSDEFDYCEEVKIWVVTDTEAVGGVYLNLYYEESFFSVTFMENFDEPSYYPDEEFETFEELLKYLQNTL